EESCCDTPVSKFHSQTHPKCHVGFEPSGTINAANVDRFTPTKLLQESGDLLLCGLVVSANDHVREAFLHPRIRHRLIIDHVKALNDLGVGEHTLNTFP